MGTVYVIQETIGRNILPASEYGQLDVLLPPGQITLSPGPSIFRLRKKLKDYCDEDYLLLIGDPIAIALASMVAASVNQGKVNFLKWDKQEQKYFPVKSDLNRKLSDE
jgi:hypothetical protein